MANVAHKNLTGVDLHEPKGADTANSGEVYVADGAGSGAWSAIADPFTQELLHVREQVSSGGTCAGTAGSFATLTLNTTVTNEIASASLTSNQISLPAGTYFIIAHSYGKYQWTTTSGTSLIQLRLRNITDTSTILAGPAVSSQIQATGGAGQQWMACNLMGKFTIAATKTVALQQYAGMGSYSLTTGEVWAPTEVFIWKMA